MYYGAHSALLEQRKESQCITAGHEEYVKAKCVYKYKYAITKAH